MLIFIRPGHVILRMATESFRTYVHIYLVLHDLLMKNTKKKTEKTKRWKNAVM